jgi:hypothetical protein
MSIYIIKHKELQENNNIVYIGSSVSPIKQVWTLHRSNYNTYKKTGKMKRSSSMVLNKYGVENCICEVLEEVVEWNELHNREWFYIQKYMDSCVNKVRPTGISDKTILYRL